MTQPRHSFIERMVEQTLFASRWLLVPFYLGLAAGLVLLLMSFVQKFIGLVAGAVTASANETIIGVLTLIDLSLMANLLLIVMFSGFDTFVTKLDLEGHRDRPDWIGKVGISDVKMKLLASIVAISAIQLLESFMHVGEVADRVLAWSVGIHVTFLVSGLILAVMDRVSGSHD
jgi:uncharacterized protein (TIGR00645 family)